MTDADPDADSMDDPDADPGPGADTDSEVAGGGPDATADAASDAPDRLDPEHPWLPADPEETFDPVAASDIDIGPNTPMVVTPRGGAREVGRSCHQLDTAAGTYLVDAGLNQGSGGQFPDFRGLDPEQIDAVFLTHAHIDHCGALPVLEARGLLDADAEVVATPPTAQIAHTLLQDSLKIHRREARRPGRDLHFTEDDVAAVHDRFETVHYGRFRAADRLDGPPIEETLAVRYGNAAHLLGSAWIAFEKSGHRLLFSGDLGGRASHLPDIEEPPGADALILESTYGSVHSHRSMRDARTELFEIVEEAIETYTPVLIPTFSVGRAQLLMLLFQERLQTIPDDRSRIALVLDGMARDATRLYHAHVDDRRYFDDAIVNRVHESGFDRPFLPAETVLPADDADRESVLDTFDPGAETDVPVVVSPSGMLTGGNSPRYLAEFVDRFDTARVVLTGYQALGTPGRAIRDAVKADAETVTVTTDTNPVGKQWSGDAVRRTRDADGERHVEIDVPTEWVDTVEGLSAHAAQHGLLAFARAVEPRTVALVHGPAHAQQHLATHLADNVDAVDAVTRARFLTPLSVELDPNIPTPVVADDDSETLRSRVGTLVDDIAALDATVAESRNDPGLSEATVRRIVRDELANELDDDPPER